MGIEWLAKELNPRYDMTRHNSNDESFVESMKDIGWFAVNMAKSFVRGAAVGTTLGAPIGALSSMLMGGDVMEGAKYGAGTGLTLMPLDVFQYTIRFVNHTLKKRRMPIVGRAILFTFAGGLSVLGVYSDTKYKHQLEAVNESFIKAADTSLDGKIDNLELGAVNTRLQNYYSSSNFIPAVTSSNLTGTHKLDYLKSLGQNPNGSFIYFLEKNQPK